MNAAQAIAQLDRFLSRGEDVTLVRLDDNGAVLASVTCRARVDRTKTDDAPAGRKPSGFTLILSPTPLLAASWPDGSANVAPQENANDRVALRGDDARTVVWVDAKRIDNQIVRIDLRVSG